MCMIRHSLFIVGEARLYVANEMVARSHNLVLNSGLNNIIDYLGRNLVASGGLAYIAAGSSTTAVSATQTSLVNEKSRALIGARILSGTSLIVQSFFLAQDINIRIEEVGVLLDGASLTPSSSDVMFSRALLSYDNSGNTPVDVTLEWSFQIETKDDG